ncbi:hypothetical protein AADZ86_04840 [Colwelliaceae bacterium BS250]
MKSIFNVITFLSSIVFLLVSQSVKAEEGEWTVFVEPYAQATTISGDTAIGRGNEADITVDFDKILKNLHLGAMINIKAIHTSGWGAAINYAFMDLRGSASGDIAAAKVRQGELQAEIVYLQKHGDATLEYLLGLRWWDNDIDLNLSTAQDRNIALRVDEDWVDFFVGARWVAPINNEWSYMVRGDIGKGGTKFTSSVEAGIQYKLFKNGLLTLKYKSTWLNYENGTPGEVGYYKYDTVTHGPAIAYTHKF